MEDATYGHLGHSPARGCPKLGLSIWLSGLVALAVVMPTVASPHLDVALARHNVELPALTEIGFWLGTGVSSIYGISALVLLALVTTMAAWSPIGHRLGRSYAMAGAIILLGVGACAASVHATTTHVQQALEAEDRSPSPR